ncbi:MAG: hypothetical protein QM535_18160 [Limnohabitans sp.]|nr:hypothetical protein [Limnohabitans sp.]
MNIIDELISSISTQENSITDILIRTKILAFELKNETLKTWIENELNGYNTKDKLPSYRVLPCQVIGRVSNGYSTANNYPIPLIGLDKDITKMLNTINFTESISGIEALCDMSESKKIGLNVLPNMYPYLSRDFDNGFVIEYARKEISVVQVIQIVTAVKSKLLDFLLELKETVGNNNVENFSIKKEIISSLLNSAVFGNNTTIIVGNDNSQNVKIEANIINNFEELSKYLTDNKVEKEDIEELSAIIDIDNQDSEKKEYGSKVKGWVNKMISKAMDGSWTIGLAAAGKVLADGISKYYGWK